MNNELLFKSKPSLLIYIPKILFIFVLIFISIHFKAFLDPIFYGFLNLIAFNAEMQTFLNNYYHFETLIFIISSPFLLLTSLHILRTLNTVYYFNKERLILESGILNKEKDYIEYFRIRDYSIKRPLIARLFKRANLTLLTTDRTHPEITLYYINNFYQNEQLIRDIIKNILIETGRGREIDIV